MTFKLTFHTIGVHLQFLTYSEQTLWKYPTYEQILQTEKGEAYLAFDYTI